MPNKTVILAAYDNAHDAHMAIRELYNGGFQKNDIHYTSDENDDLESILNEDRPDPTHEGLGAIFSNVIYLLTFFCHVIHKISWRSCHWTIGSWC